MYTQVIFIFMSKINNWIRKRCINCIVYETLQNLLVKLIIIYFIL